MPSRFKLASHACRTYSGLPLIPSLVPSAVLTFPNFVAVRLQRFADEYLIGAGAVYVGCVEQRYSEFDRPVNRRDRLFLISLTVRLRHSHAAEAEGRNLQTCLA
jgi:hypothetical protein